MLLKTNIVYLNSFFFAKLTFFCFKRYGTTVQSHYYLSLFNMHVFGLLLSSLEGFFSWCCCCIVSIGPRALLSPIRSFPALNAAIVTKTSSIQPSVVHPSVDQICSRGASVYRRSVLWAMYYEVCDMCGLSIIDEPHIKGKSTQTRILEIGSGGHTRWLILCHESDAFYWRV